MPKANTPKKDQWVLDKERTQGVIEESQVFDLSNKEEAKRLTDLVQTSDKPISVRVHEGDVNNMSFGVAMPKNHPTPSKYLKSLKMYNDSEQDIYEQMKLARKLYEHEGIVGTVLDMYIDLSCADFKVKGIRSEKARKLIDFWRKNVNKGNNNVDRGAIHVVRGFAQEFYLNGNVFAYTRWGQTRIPKSSTKYRLPMTMVSIDPVIIEIPEESVQFGNKVMQINLDRVWGKRMVSKDERRALIESLPTKIRNRAKEDKLIPLQPNEVYHIRRKGAMYAGWGIPYLTRAISSIASKRKLRQLDDNTIDGLINSVTIFKIGDPKYPETWKPSRLRAFSNLLSGPTDSLYLVWSWDIDVAHVSPDGDLLDMANRYADVNRDILYALGIPLSLLTGQGEKAGDVWASIVFILERLKEFKDKMKSYFEFIIESILVENGFKDEMPVVEFIKPKLNSADISNVVFGLYDRGLLSKETAGEETGYDTYEEWERRKFEKESGMEDDMPRPDIPFAANPDSPDDEEDEKTPPKPNPQTDEDSGAPDSNKEKDTKITKVNDTTKKPSPRMEGTAHDRMKILLDTVFAQGRDFTATKQALHDVGTQLYGLDPQKMHNLLGISANDYNAVVKFITSRIRKSDPNFKSKMQEKLDRYFG